MHQAVSIDLASFHRAYSDFDDHQDIRMKMVFIFAGQRMGLALKLSSPYPSGSNWNSFHLFLRRDIGPRALRVSKSKILTAHNIIWTLYHLLGCFRKQITALQLSIKFIDALISTQKKRSYINKEYDFLPKVKTTILLRDHARGDQGIKKCLD